MWHLSEIYSYFIRSLLLKSDKKFTKYWISSLQELAQLPGDVIHIMLAIVWNSV
jgi:hypothetical protein